ncbi:MAG: alpha-amylase family glycosyl hydrolase [Anaerolineaceae bacterium]
MTPWTETAVLYHIYPLGFCGAPGHNDFTSAPGQGLEKILPWLDHIQSLGANAMYLGPLFESTTHGYDTADYYTVDRRLGTRGTLAYLSGQLHERGMRLILDGVFNHVGRDFWAFKDVQRNGENSPYRDWFLNLHFNGRSPYGDAFTYEGWSGHYNLVKLNLRNRQVREHLFGAVRMWVEEFNIDGLRLDTADLLDKDFMKELRSFCRSLRPYFWLMGEVIHGDYREWVNPEMLDSVTSYETHKGLYSSHVDKNYFEIAYSLNRQFGGEGIYKELRLYSFVDNHDVERLASCLTNQSHLFPVHILLFTVPGIPSIYYGSEWGLRGKRIDGRDEPLRPSLDLNVMLKNPPQPGLAEVISRLASIHRDSPALRRGSYRQLLVQSEQFAFMRETDGEKVAVVVNAADHEVTVRLPILGEDGHSMVDLLNEGETFRVENSACEVTLPPAWGRILRIV